jgi:glycine/D-amino acid oxidase-like deaminating enzyme/nitrite reductase/ring-hydroxylating ferredoxin subunit
MGVYMESVWKKTCIFSKREQLNQDIKADAAVIGAGMAGILTAALLHQKGVDVVVLEGSRIAGGQTERTTAKITLQHDLIYDKLIHKFGREKAYQYAAANREAIDLYKKMIEEYNIDCHFEELPAYVYTLKDISKIEKEVEAAKNLGIDAEFTTQTTLPFKVMGAAKYYNQAQFNPLEFLTEVVKPLKIFEHTMVKDIDGHKVITDHGIVEAKHIVVATHYPFLNTPGYYFLRMHQERSYVLGLANGPKLDGTYIDENDQGYSFRNYKDMLILGGGGHRTGENTTGGRYEKLRKAADEYFPESIEVCCWSAQDCMTLDDIPYIGQYSASTPYLYVATGFKKWGMTSSMVSAMLLSDIITGNKNPYEEVFSPQRFQVNASIKNFLNEGKHAAAGLFRGNFKIPDTKLEQIQNGHGGIIDYEDNKIGVYKDENGNFYMVSTKCTHLGCQLEWNPDELTWDCPCHGSRFSYTGKLISNPAMESLENA